MKFSKLFLLVALPDIFFEQNEKADQVWYPAVTNLTGTDQFVFGRTNSASQAWGFYAIPFSTLSSSFSTNVSVQGNVLGTAATNNSDDLTKTLDGNSFVSGIDTNLSFSTNILAQQGIARDATFFRLLEFTFSSWPQCNSLRR